VTETPFVAGMYDYYLGGTANSAADRAAVEKIRAVIPDIGEAAWANRGFLQRAVKRMAADWGITQFIDIGAGLPTQRNTHDVAFAGNPEAKVVYVDIDQRVVDRGTAMLAGEPNATVIHGDLRRPAEVLADPELRRMIDFGRPVGLLMVAVLQFVGNDEDPYGVVRSYVDAVPPGSYLAIAAPTADRQADSVLKVVDEVYRATPTPGTARSKDEVARFFDGLEVVPPYEGAAPEVAYVGVWGAEDPEAADDDSSHWFYACVGRKP
jgi:hypothetical protein